MNTFQVHVHALHRFTFCYMREWGGFGDGDRDRVSKVQKSVVAGFFENIFSFIFKVRILVFVQLCCCLLPTFNFGLYAFVYYCRYEVQLNIHNENNNKWKKNNARNVRQPQECFVWKCTCVAGRAMATNWTYRDVPAEMGETKSADSWCFYY